MSLGSDGKITVEIEADDRASAKLRQVARELEGLQRSMGGIGSGWHSEYFQKMYYGASRANSAFRMLQNSMSFFTNSTKRLLREAGAAVVSFTKDSIKAYDDFSESHAKMIGTLGASAKYNGPNGQQLLLQDSERLKKQAITIGSFGSDGRGSLETVQDVSNIQLMLSRAGISSDSMLNTDIINNLIKFAKGNDIQMEDAVQFAVSAGNQFKYKPEDWGKMFDKISHTADLAPITVSDIVESMKYAGGISSGLNRPIDETLGMIATLGNFGLRGSQAGSGIQAMLTRLLTQDTTVITQAQADVAPPNALKAFYDFSKYAKSDGSGLSYKQIKNAKSYDDFKSISGNLRPMSEVVDQMEEVMAGLTDEEQAWFAKKLFGLYQMKSAYGLMSGEEQDLNTIVTNIKEQSAGTNDRKYEEVANSAYGEAEKLKSAWQGVKTQFGDSLEPFTKKVREELISFLGDPGNYNVDFDGLHSALDDACDEIEKNFGTAIANAVHDIGDFSIDLTQVLSELGPDMGEGIANIFSSLAKGDIFGSVKDFGNMIDKMHESADELPEDLQGMGHAIASIVGWAGNLIAIDVGAKIGEIISSLAMVGSIVGDKIFGKAIGSMNVNAGVVNVNGGVGGGGIGGTGTGGTGGTGGSGGAAGTSFMSRFLGEGKTTKQNLSSVLGWLAVAVPTGMSIYDAVSTNNEIDKKREEGEYVEKSEVWAKAGESFGSAALGVLTLAATGNPLLAAGAAELGKTMGTGSPETFFGGAGYYGNTGIGVYDDWRREKVQDDYDNFVWEQANTKKVTDKNGNVTEIKNDNLNLAKALADKGLGDGFLWWGLDQEDWNKAIMNPRDKDSGIFAEYDKMNGNDRLELEGLLNKYPYSTLGNASEFKEVWKSGKWGDGYDAEKERNEANKTIEDLKAIGAEMLVINKDNKLYDKKYDKDNRGSYTLWTGTQEQYLKYLEADSKRLHMTSLTNDGSNPNENYDPSKHKGASTDNPYSLSEMSSEIRSAIIEGLSADPTKSGTNMTDLQSQIASQIQSGLASGSFTIQKADVTGSLNIPDIASNIAKSYPGWNALSSEGKEKVIENAINNNIQIDDSVTMTPSFSVAAPIVNVDVKVDKSGNVSKNIITSPGTASLLDSWYNRTHTLFGDNNNTKRKG